MSVAEATSLSFSYCADPCSKAGRREVGEVVACESTSTLLRVAFPTEPTKPAKGSTVCKCGELYYEKLVVSIAKILRQQVHNVLDRMIGLAEGGRFCAPDAVINLSFLSKSL